MQPLEIIGAIVMIIISVLLIIVCAMQDSKEDGISALGGAGFATGSNDRSISAKIAKGTKLLAVLFFVIAVAVSLIYTYLA